MRRTTTIALSTKQTHANLVGWVLFATDQNELIAQRDPCVVFNRQVVELVAALTLVGQVITGANRPVDARGLKADSR